MMLRTVLLAATAMVASPALAQVATPAPQEQATTAANAPATAQPAQPSTSAQSAAPSDQAAPAGQPVSGGSAIAQVVETEWSAYDANGDGKLSETEFAAWMNKLKGASDPNLKPDAPATKKWNASAFAQADKDKSRSLSKAELTGFLSQGQS